MEHSRDGARITRGQFMRMGLMAMGAGAVPGVAFAADATNAASVAMGSEGVLQGDSLPHGLPADDEAAARLGIPWLMRGTRETKKVALTYDDGPCPLTDRVLDTLEKYKAKATFFMIGNKVKASPATARRVHAAGHEIANHSYTHPALGKMASSAVARELADCQKAIEDAVAISPRWMRPPYGSFTSGQGPLAKANRLNVVIWSVDPQDWRRPGVGVVQQRVLSESSGGSIILLHDIHEPTIEASPGIIAGLVEKGYELVTLSELVLGPA